MNLVLWVAGMATAVFGASAIAVAVWTYAGHRSAERRRVSAYLARLADDD